MGIFNRKPQTIELTNGIDINSLNTDRICRPFTFNFGGKGKKNFADILLYSIVGKIFNSLNNVRWFTTETDYLADDIINFVNNNSQLLIYHYWYSGYATIIIEKNGRIRLPYTNEIRKDNNGYVANANAVTIYSQPYQIERKSHLQIIQPLLASINSTCNNGDFLTSNLGALGILSGKSMPISPAAKDDVQEKLRKQYGLGEDKFQFIVSNTELEYKQIQIPVTHAQLNDTLTEQTKMLCRYFNLNPDLIMAGSTFSNQAEAIRAFYHDCIMPLAEVLLLLARNLYIKQSNANRPSTIITYDMSNVPEFNHTLSEKCQDLGAYVDYLIKLKDAGVDVEEELQKAYMMSKELINNV